MEYFSWCQGQGAAQSAALPTYCPLSGLRPLLDPCCGKRPLRAQGATEYLVILSVVLVISLVSISLMGYGPSVSSDVAYSASKSYWQSEARPIAVTEAGLTGDSAFSFVVQNNNPDPVSLTGISIDSQAVSFSEVPADPSNTSTVYVAPGEKKALNLALANSGFNCKEGSYGQAALRFTYSTPYNRDLIEESNKMKFMLKCSMNSGVYANQSGGNPQSTYWTQWYNRDDPGGSGDWEIREFEVPPPCGDYSIVPVGFECRTSDTHTPADQTGQILSWYNPADGCICESWRNNWSCLDYEVRFLCPQ